jgi:hypothetical protein
MVSDLFSFVADELERKTSLSTLEARGTLRIALKNAGLDPAVVTKAQLTIVLGKVLPGELESRAISNPEALCRDMVDQIGGVEIAERDLTDDAAAVFGRIYG